MLPLNAYRKAKKAKKRLPQFEALIASDPDAAWQYACDVIKGPWGKSHVAESVICQNPECAYKYALFVLKGRWKPGEAVILKNSVYCVAYAREVMKKRWSAAEAVLTDAWDCAEYAAEVIKGPWKKAERFIRKEPEAAALYARDVLNRRWRAAEAVIAQNPRWAADYAVNVIGGRWKQAEAVIAGDEVAAGEYLAVLEQNWDPAAVALCTMWMYRYARSCTRGQLPTGMHNKMMMTLMKYPDEKWAKKYFAWLNQRQVPKTRARKGKS